MLPTRLLDHSVITGRAAFFGIATGAFLALTSQAADTAGGLIFRDAEAQARQFMEWERTIRLSPEQEQIKKAALSSIPAPCCSDNSAHTWLLPLQYVSYDLGPGQSHDRRAERRCSRCARQNRGVDRVHQSRRLRRQSLLHGPVSSAFPRGRLRRHERFSAQLLTQQTGYCRRWAISAGARCTTRGARH